MTAVVEASSLRKTYGETVALENVSLSVADGEIFALIGPNGAGKTTLVRSLTGTTVPDAGTARLWERAPTAVDESRLGVLPQEFSPPDRLSARELLEYYAGLYDDARDPEAVLEDVGLADAGDTWYENLSGGQKRRVCVGSALVNDPDVLFLDEPTTGIDPAGRRTVWRLIEALAAGGTTVVLTTHDMAEAERLADRVGLLADGSLVASGPPTTLIEEYGGASRLTIETAERVSPDLFDGLEGRQTGTDAAEIGAAETDVAEISATEIEAAEIDARDGALVFEDVSPTAIGAVVDVLEGEGIEYTSLTWSEPDLERAYLELADDAEAARTARSGSVEGQLEGQVANAELEGARDRPAEGNR
ncbi:ABC transporter ATP-binding protein [Halostagnicola kamekurae]|uniref:ABC-2 type transport system ATP-binding protein n=1 Tax=Halostagnicola kamekurae TaxID=619731 RepID=A0A1I6SE11_9EURY|nr:ABC transporter ATP-binding protein [Halostagnicola kamekurae]SFS75164.1 ABC-2 type transport system ATP-binding protein [Halostagnicola kamekurae]